MYWRWINIHHCPSTCIYTVYGSVHRGATVLLIPIHISVLTGFIISWKQNQLTRQSPLHDVTHIHQAPFHIAKTQGLYLLRKHGLTGIGISIINMRRLSDHLSFLPLGLSGWRGITIACVCPPVRPSVVLGVDESPRPCGTPSWYTPFHSLE